MWGLVSKLKYFTAIMNIIIQKENQIPKPNPKLPKPKTPKTRNHPKPKTPKPKTDPKPKSPKPKTDPRPEPPKTQN